MSGKAAGERIHQGLMDLHIEDTKPTTLKGKRTTIPSAPPSSAVAAHASAPSFLAASSKTDNFSSGTESEANTNLSASPSSLVNRIASDTDWGRGSRHRRAIEQSRSPEFWRPTDSNSEEGNQETQEPCAATAVPPAAHLPSTAASCCASPTTIAGAARLKGDVCESSCSLLSNESIGMSNTQNAAQSAMCDAAAIQKRAEQGGQTGDACVCACACADATVHIDPNVNGFRGVSEGTATTSSSSSAANGTSTVAGNAEGAEEMERFLAARAERRRKLRRRQSKCEAAFVVLAYASILRHDPDESMPEVPLSQRCGKSISGGSVVTYDELFSNDRFFPPHHSSCSTASAGRRRSRKMFLSPDDLSCIGGNARGSNGSIGGELAGATSQQSNASPPSAFFSHFHSRLADVIYSHTTHTDAPLQLERMLRGDSDSTSLIQYVRNFFSPLTQWTETMETNHCAENVPEQGKTVRLNARSAPPPSENFPRSSLRTPSSSFLRVIDGVLSWDTVSNLMEPEDDFGDHIRIALLQEFDRLLVLSAGNGEGAGQEVSIHANPFSRTAIAGDSLDVTPEDLKVARAELIEEMERRYNSIVTSFVANNDGCGPRVVSSAVLLFQRYLMMSRIAFELVEGTWLNISPTDRERNPRPFTLLVDVFHWDTRHEDVELILQGHFFMNYIRDAWNMQQRDEHFNLLFVLRACLAASVSFCLGITDRDAATLMQSVETCDDRHVIDRPIEECGEEGERTPSGHCSDRPQQRRPLAMRRYVRRSFTVSVGMQVLLNRRHLLHMLAWDVWAVSPFDYIGLLELFFSSHAKRSGFIGVTPQENAAAGAMRIIRQLCEDWEPVSSSSEDDEERSDTNEEEDSDEDPCERVDSESSESSTWSDSTSDWYRHMLRGLGGADAADAQPGRTQQHAAPQPPQTRVGGEGEELVRGGTPELGASTNSISPQPMAEAVSTNQRSLLSDSLHSSFSAPLTQQSLNPQKLLATAPSRRKSRQRMFEDEMQKLLLSSFSILAKISCSARGVGTRNSSVLAAVACVCAVVERMAGKVPASSPIEDSDDTMEVDARDPPVARQALSSPKHTHTHQRQATPQPHEAPPSPFHNNCPQHSNSSPIRHRQASLFEVNSDYQSEDDDDDTLSPPPARLDAGSSTSTIVPSRVVQQTPEITVHAAHGAKKALGGGGVDGEGHVVRGGGGIARLASSAGRNASLSSSMFAQNSLTSVRTSHASHARSRSPSAGACTFHPREAAPESVLNDTEKLTDEVKNRASLLRWRRDEIVTTLLRMTSWGSVDEVNFLIGTMNWLGL